MLCQHEAKIDLCVSLPMRVGSLLAVYLSEKDLQVTALTKERYGMPWYQWLQQQRSLQNFAWQIYEK
jgi:hypothetical protein